jgi:branched-chain amino acid transport system substrate-binding protein
MKTPLRLQLFNFIASFLLTYPLATSVLAETSADPVSGKEVVIGAVIPLSGSQSLYGTEAARLFELLSEGPGYSHNGTKFRLIVEDGKCGLGSAPITAAKKLVLMDKAKYLIAGCSGEVLQIAPFAQQKKVVLFGYISGHRDVKHAGDYVFRTFYDIGTIGTITNDKLTELGLSRLAIITEEVSFTLGIKDVLLDTLGKKVIAKEDYPLDAPDYRGIIARVKQRAPDSVFINSAAPLAYTQIYNELRRIGFQGPVFSYYQAGNREVLSSLGAAQDNVWYLSAPIPVDSAARYLEIRERYIKRFGPEINSEFQLAAAYNALQSIIDSVAAVGDDPTKVKEYLTSYSAPGATGQIKYDANGDIMNVSLVLQKIEKGKTIQAQ